MTTIINRTPHDIVILPTSGTASDAPILRLPAAPRGEVARVEQTTNNVDGLVATVDGAVVPIGRAEWGAVVGLPAPQPGVLHVVSVVVVEAAVDSGRDAWDLLVPGDQVRDAGGRIVGCRGLVDGVSASPAMSGRRARAVADRIHQRLDPEADNLRPDPEALAVEAEGIVAAHDRWVHEAGRLRKDGGWSYDATEPHGALRTDLVSTCRRAVTASLARPGLGPDEARRVALTELLAAIGAVALDLPPGCTGLKKTAM